MFFTVRELRDTDEKINTASSAEAVVVVSMSGDTWHGPQPLFCEATRTKAVRSVVVFRAGHFN